jgi:hypothetical protein
MVVVLVRKGPTGMKNPADWAGLGKAAIAGLWETDL